MDDAQLQKLIEEFNANETAIKTLEDEALAHEQSARDCRAKRQELKQRQTELRSTVSMGQSSKAMQTVEASKGQIETLLKDVMAEKTALSEERAKLNQERKALTALVEETQKRMAVAPPKE